MVAAISFFSYLYCSPYLLDLRVLESHSFKTKSILKFKYFVYGTCNPTPQVFFCSVQRLHNVTEFQQHNCLTQLSSWMQFKQRKIQQIPLIMENPGPVQTFNTAPSMWQHHSVFAALFSSLPQFLASKKQCIKWNVFKMISGIIMSYVYYLIQNASI